MTYAKNDNIVIILSPVKQDALRRVALKLLWTLFEPLCSC
jgi:hypothetical protein